MHEILQSCKKTEIQKQVNDITKFKTAKRSYPRQTGHIYSHLGDVLKRNKISGQAYHGHSFIGNHWIKYLKTNCNKEHSHQNIILTMSLKSQARKKLKF